MNGRCYNTARPRFVEHTKHIGKKFTGLQNSGTAANEKMDYQQL